jgi:hypothetical protein
MIKQLLTLTFVAFTFSSFAQSDSFEGTATMETSTAKTDETAQVTVHVKGNNARLDFISTTPGHTSEYSIIIDSKGADIVSKGIVTKLDLDKAITPKGKMLPVLKEGGVEKNGHICTHYQFSDGEQTIDYWMSSDFGLDQSQLPDVFSQGMPKPEGALKGLNIAMTVVDKDGNLLSSQKLLSVQPSKVNDSIFDRK